MKRIKHILIAAMVLVMVAMFANANIPPAPAGLDNDTGNYWVNYTWSKDTDHPVNNNVTDSFKVSMNGTWYNGTATFLNKGVGPGGWANITVWAYNATGNGNISVGNVSDSVQAPSAATEPAHLCGYIPPPMDLSHLDEIPVKRIQPPCALPSFDWRDSGNVTPVKDQSTCGTCWIFGTTSVLESAVLINEGAECNFSEQSVALCVDRSWTYLYDGADDPCNAGGWGWLAAEAFIKKGSVPESCNPYNTTALNCDGSCVCDDCTPVKKVDGYRLVTDNGSDLDAIKTAVYDHGPVTMAFFVNSSAFSYGVEHWGTIYDYYPCPPHIGLGWHLVSIIGWNDSVPHPDTDHDGTGAWIVKNSWGTDWGNGGYFYLAYNSSCVTEIAYLEYKDPVPDEELLYWDEAGFVGYMGCGDSGAWMASVFTTDQSGNLTHVDFWTTSNNAEYEIYVWDGFFGSELANQTGSCSELGYYSIPLNTPIPMDACQQFTVGVNMTTPDYGYPIPVEFAYLDMVDPTIQSNVSFIRQNGSDPWTDLADENKNACLRARIAIEPPDIGITPAEFDLTLYRGDVVNKTLTIGNDGVGTLTFEISDAETTAPHSPMSIPASDGNFPRDSAPVSIDRAPVTPAPVEEPAILTEFVLSAGEPAFAMDLQNEDMAYIPDTTTPGTWNIVGATPGTSFFAGDFLNGDFSKMYVLDYSANTLSTVDTTTAAVTLIGSCAPISEQSWAAGMTGATDGTLYAASTNISTSYLYTIDPNPGVPTVVGQITNASCIIDIAINAAGEMCGVDIVNDVLVEINPATGAGTVVGSIGFDANYAQGMDFEEVSGVLYLAAYNTASGGELRIADTSTGNTVLVGAFPDGNEADCLAFQTFDCLWLDEDPKTGDVEPGNYDEITVTINTTDVRGKHSAEIRISNNDPDEDPVEIPVNLTVLEPCTCGDICVDTGGWWRNNSTFNTNGTPIQAAVDAAAAGETICVAAGTYDENVDIGTPHLTLAGEGADAVNVIADLSSDHVFNVTADYVNISRFNVTGATVDGKAGIYLSGRQHCNISDNRASNSYYGIRLNSSSNNTVTKNNVSNGDHGICMGYSSNNNTVTNNTANSNKRHGIRLRSSSNNNVVTDNTANSNDDYGIWLYDSSNNTFSGNTASNNWMGIYLVCSSNNTLTSNTASGNDYGIWLYDSSNNTLTSNTASGNDYGIWLYDSSNNTLTSNTASNNYECGIMLGAGGRKAEGANNTTSNNFGRRSPVSSNDASDKGYGIVLDAGVEMVEGASNNTLTSNTASGNNHGIWLYDSSNNTLYQNSMYNHSYSNAIDCGANNWNSSSLGNYYDLAYQTYMLTETAYSWINTTQSDADWNDNDDDHSPKVPIGFDFILDNVTYTHIRVVSNGVIQLIPDGGTELDADSCASPTYWSTNYPDKTFIFALCDDLCPDTGWYGYTTYTAGDNDSGNNPITQNLTVIDYHVATISDGNYTTNPNDYQVVLYESGTMRFNFKNLNYTMFGYELYSGIYLGNSSSTYAKETIHVARAGQYSNNGTSYSTPIIRTLSSTYDDNGDGIADTAYPIGNAYCGTGTAVDNYPLVTASKASSPATASSRGAVSFTVSTTVIDHASVGIDNITLYYKMGGGTWTKYTESTTGTFTFPTSSGGDYYFYTVATDNCGKVEGVPSTYDSKTTVSSSSGGSSGGDGTYPPGWFETPTPTVTATKAPAATTTATDAPPGERVTPTPTKKTAAAKAAAPAAEGTTAGDAKKDAPRFTAVFVIAGLLVVAYLVMRRRG